MCVSSDSVVGHAHEPLIIFRSALEKPDARRRILRALLDLHPLRGSEGAVDADPGSTGRHYIGPRPEPGGAVFGVPDPAFSVGGVGDE